MFGWQLREAHFNFGEGVVNLNHGSYGCAPQDVLDARLGHMREETSFPDQFYRLDHAHVTDSAREEFAKALDADVEDVVCVVNATSGVNAVLRSLFPTHGRAPHILKFSTIYNSCDHTLQMLEEKFDWRVDSVHLELPLNSIDDISMSLKTALETNPDKYDLVMFDTVTSMPSIRFPWEDMVRICRDHGALSLVDGAHGIGLIPIRLRTVQPDFFVTNAHKWFFAPHSVAALYVHRKHHREINSLPVSAVYYPRDAKLGSTENTTALARTFDYVGTADRSAVASVADAVRFRNTVCGGEAAIIFYQNMLSETASAYLRFRFHTTEVADFGSQYRTAMFTLKYPYQPDPQDMAEFVVFTNTYMMTECKTIMPLSVYDDVVYVRFSAAPYLDMADFVYGGDVITRAIDAWHHRARAVLDATAVTSEPVEPVEPAEPVEPSS